MTEIIEYVIHHELDKIIVTIVTFAFMWITTYYDDIIESVKSIKKDGEV